MFLVCFYFFRNLSLNVLLSMVLFKKNGCIAKLCYCQYIDYRIKEKFVWGPKFKFVGVRLPLLLGPLEQSSTVTN